MSRGKVNKNTHRKSNLRAPKQSSASDFKKLSLNIDDYPNLIELKSIYMSVLPDTPDKRLLATTTDFFSFLAAKEQVINIWDELGLFDQAKVVFLLKDHYDHTISQLPTKYHDQLAKKLLDIQFTNINKLLEFNQFFNLEIMLMSRDLLLKADDKDQTPHTLKIQKTILEDLVGDAQIAENIEHEYLSSRPLISLSIAYGLLNQQSIDLNKKHKDEIDRITLALDGMGLGTITQTQKSVMFLAKEAVNFPASPFYKDAVGVTWHSKAAFVFEQESNEDSSTILDGLPK